MMRMYVFLEVPWTSIIFSYTFKDTLCLKKSRKFPEPNSPTCWGFSIFLKNGSEFLKCTIPPFRLPRFLHTKGGYPRGTPRGKGDTLDLVLVTSSLPFNIYIKVFYGDHPPTRIFPDHVKFDRLDINIKSGV